MLKIAVCDDEAIICSEIVNLLESLHNNYEIFEFYSGNELMKSIFNFDIVILDIEIPGENGIRIAEKIRQHSADIFIVFLTGHSEFIHTAFKVKAFRYLSKPIAEDDLFEAVTAAEKEILGVKSIVLKIQGNLTVVKLTDIIYLEAFGDGTYIYTVNRVYTSDRSLKNILSLMKNNMLFQVNKSFAVSFNHIKNITRFEIEMTNGKGNIPISRRNTAAFKKAYFGYIKRNSLIL